MAAPPQPRATLTIRRHLTLIVFTVAAVATRGACARASTHTTAAAPAPRASSSSSSVSASPAAASYLRARCATTLYPALCYDSLLPYASKVQDNPARLARVAADVAVARLRALSARVKDILRHGGGTEPAEAEGGGGGGGGRPSETSALRDCASTISAAASLARQSSAELTKLEPDAAGTASSAAAGGGSRQARWEVSNAKTWLSAAMSNEGTCADGLVEAGAEASSAGKEVTAGVATVKQYTSNALALVNGIPV